MELPDADIDIARSLIGLALTATSQDRGGYDALLNMLKDQGLQDLARVASWLISAIAETVAESSEQFDSGEDVLRWYAESFGRGGD